MPRKSNAELEQEIRQLRLLHRQELDKKDDALKSMKENMTILEGMNVMSNFVLRRLLISLVLNSRYTLYSRQLQV
jgi:hypothetical protein